MERASIQIVMLGLAAATPVVGFCVLRLGASIARQSDEPMPASMRRAGWLLILAGPLNLLVWFLFNEWLTAVGYRSVVGYAVAAAVFFAMGWTSGAFGRLRGRIGRRETPGEDS